MNIEKNIIIILTVLTFVLPAAVSVTAKTVTDQAGRVLGVPENPVRVIALAPSVTEIVFELGQGRRLVGATRFSTYPPAAEKLPKVGSYIHLDLEKIVALKPDLCIGVKDGNPIATVRRLDAMNIPMYALNPTDFDSFLATIPAIGNLLNCPDRAKSLVEGLRQRIRDIESKVAVAERRPGVFFQIGITPIVSAGSSTFIDELITRAGGMNLARGPVLFPRYSREQVLALMPDIVIITSMARKKGFEVEKDKWRTWPQMPAVRDNRIHLVDSDIVDRPTPRLVKGLETVARLIHPALFEEEGRGE